MKRIALYISLALVAAFSAAAVVVLWGASSEVVKTGSNQQTNTVIEPAVESKLVAKHTIEYVEKPVTEVKYVERITSVPFEFRNFRTVDELEQWLEVKASTTSVFIQSPGTVIDCDDYAIELQQKALADGFIISFQVIGVPEYNTLFKSQLPEDSNLHAINLAIIGNGIYYIEPQTGEIVLAANLD